MSTPTHATLMSIDDLHPSPVNPRTITEERFEALQRSLLADPDFLYARPLIATPAGEVVAGNMRLRACIALVDKGHDRYKQVPVFVAELDEDRKRLWMLRDNQEYGDWEEQALAEVLYELRESGVDLDLTGIPEGDVQIILDGVGAAAPQFKDIDEQHVDYECPSCGYGWAGAPRPGARAKKTDLQEGA